MDTYNMNRRFTDKKYNNPPPPPPLPPQSISRIQLLELAVHLTAPTLAKGDYSVREATELLITNLDIISSVVEEELDLDITK